MTTVTRDDVQAAIDRRKPAIPHTAIEREGRFYVVRNDCVDDDSRWIDVTWALPQVAKETERHARQR